MDDLIALNGWFISVVNAAYTFIYRLLANLSSTKQPISIFKTLYEKVCGNTM